jgi:glycosyltransferase involved in cell wall biosynthesis
MAAVSAENADMVRDYFGLKAEQYTYVNNGIDLQRFGRKEHEGFTLINVARHDDNKNQAMLIRCFARLRKIIPDIKLLLLGDGPTHGSLMQLADELGMAEAVTFTGNVANTEDYYAASDIYVQTSFREAMPL